MNCQCIYTSGYRKNEPHSGFCYGVRTGVLKGKEKSIKNMPKDVFTWCILLGSHSDNEGRHCFINCIGDFSLQMREMFFVMYKTGMHHQFRELLAVTPDPVIEILEREIKRRREKRENPTLIDIGTKFIEFMCSCEETFFREWNHDNDGRYYIPNEDDERLFDYHRALGHTVRYRKCKRVRLSKVGYNPLWQEWGPYEWKKRQKNTKNG